MWCPQPSSYTVAFLFPLESGGFDVRDLISVKYENVAILSLKSNMGDERLLNLLQL